MENHPSHPHHLHIQEKNIRRVFIVSLCLKAAGAALQIGFGTLLLFTGKITAIISAAVDSELIEDPNSYFAQHAAGAISHLTPHFQLFGAIYLLSHGAIKIFLVWALLKNKLWAYPASIGIFAIFIIYQLVHITRGNWIFLIALALFEIFLLGLIVHEYRYLLKKRHLPLE